jgi:hypothetical protein
MLRRILAPDEQAEIREFPYIFRLKIQFFVIISRIGAVHSPWQQPLAHH